MILVRGMCNVDGEIGECDMKLGASNRSNESFDNIFN